MVFHSMSSNILTSRNCTDRAKDMYSLLYLFLLTFFFFFQKNRNFVAPKDKCFLIVFMDRICNKKSDSEAHLLSSFEVVSIKSDCFHGFLK